MSIGCGADEVMLGIICKHTHTHDGALAPEDRDHELTGDWKGFRECHVGRDVLLIYDLRADGAIIFTRAGSHADLFE
jgi:mRNA interferase YafQ